MRSSAATIRNITATRSPASARHRISPGELFRLSEKLNFTAVPFGGGGPMILSVVAGHTPIAFSSLAPAAQQIQSGNLRALAITAEKRVESLPDVPTMTEAGFPGQVGETPIGILAPTGAPQEVIDIIHRKITAIIAQPEIKQRLSTLGFCAGRRHAGGIRRDAEGGRREVGRGHPPGGDQPAVDRRSPARSSRGSTSARR